MNKYRLQTKRRQDGFSFLYKTTPLCFELVTVHKARIRDAGQHRNKNNKWKIHGMLER